MPRKIIPLTANTPTRIMAQGRVLQIVSTGAASFVNLKVEFSSQQITEDFGDCNNKFRMVAEAQFTGMEITSPVDCSLEILISMQNVSVSSVGGETVNAQLVGSVTIPVSNDRGAPATPVYVSGITYSDAPAVTLQDNAAIAVTSAGAALVAANANRRGLRFCNIGTDPVTIGFTGITWAKRCIVLNAGDAWIEERAANLAWAAICDATKTASVTVQEVIA